MEFFLNSDSCLIYQLILDTNFFFIPFELNIDIFSEFNRIIDKKYEAIILNCVYLELLKLKKSGKVKKNIDAAIQFTEKCKKIPFYKQENEEVDDSIIRYAKNNPSIVATNDKLLRKKLKKQNIPIIFVRKKKYLKLEGMV